MFFACVGDIPLFLLVGVILGIEARPVGAAWVCPRGGYRPMIVSPFVVGVRGAIVANG